MSAFPASSMPFVPIKIKLGTFRGLIGLNCHQKRKNCKVKFGKYSGDKITLTQIQISRQNCFSNISHGMETFRGQ